MRWEEPHHPGPGLQLERHSTPLSPTLQHDPTMQAHLQPAGPNCIKFSICQIEKLMQFERWGLR
jgi:hypothetical protein